MAKLYRMDDSHLAFHCPGCGCGHQVSHSGPHPVWQWNGSMDAPTFSPSVRISSGCRVPNFKAGGDCWCTYNAAHADKPAPFKCECCHSFVEGGKIRFLGDCTHALRN